MRSDSDGDLSSINLIELNFNWSQLLKVAVTFGLQQVPYAGGLISGIVGVLWPVDKPDVWAEIKQRAEELVNRKLEDAIWKEMAAYLNGFNEALKIYLTLTRTPREKQDLEAIKRRWEAIENNFVTVKPLFQVSPHQVLLLPLFAPFATLHLTLLRDAAFDGLRWGLLPGTVEQIRKRLRETQEDYRSYTTKIYEDEFKYREGITKENFRAVEPFRSVNTFVRVMTLTVLDFRDRWPDFLVEKPVVKSLPREIFSDPAGTTAPNSGSRPPKNRPPMATRPIERIQAWGYQNLDAIQVFYPAGGAPDGSDRTPRMGTRGGSDSPPDGGNWSLKPPNLPISVVDVRSGDYVHQLGFVVKGRSLNVGGRSPGGQSVRFSCDGHILSSVYITGTNQDDRNPAAECIIFGFRYPEVQTFTLAEQEFLYVHSLEDPETGDPMGALSLTGEPDESIDAQDLETRWRAARAEYWSQVNAQAAAVQERE
ncbi:MAG: insecticidal delta-endotoxin Cry8Ea1 family protein [Blastocatellia bacterium]